ncbi:MAG: invasin domain 3-containing protein [Balneolaceae bacterium]
MSYARKYLFRYTLLSIFLIVGSGRIYAQTITPATGGSSISVDNFASGTWTNLTGPVITETSPGQLASGTMRLKTPSGFVWDVGGTAPTINVTSSKATRITVTLTSRTATELIFSITGSSAGNPKNNPHTITFSDIRVRPSQGTPIVSGNITNIGSGAPGGTINYGTLSMVAGADSQIRVESLPTAGGSLIAAQNIEAGQSLTVYSNVRDQFGNFKRNQSSTWSTESETGGVTDTDLSSSTGTSTTFNATLTGTAKIKATSGAFTAVQTGVLTVTPSAASSLSITTQPSATATAGVPFVAQPVIKILDSYNNIVTTDNFTQITATRNTGNGNLQGTVTKTAVNGVVTFTNLSHNVANTIDLTFSAMGFADVTSNTIAISPAAASKLIFTQQPVNGNRNAPVPTIEVQITDSFNNFVSQSGTLVTLSINTGSGNISGNTATTNVGGKATFSNTQFNQVGLKTIVASAPSLSNSPASNSFTIATAGTLAGFEIEIAGGGNIPTQTAGSSFNIKITAVDGIGAVIDGTMGKDNFTGNIDLTTTSTFSGATTTTSIGPFVGGVYNSHSVGLTLASNSATLTATNSAGSEFGSSNTFTIVPNSPNIDSSYVYATPDSLIADGVSESVITLQLRDEYGNDAIGNVSETILISKSSGTGSISATTGNGNGTYKATVTAPSSLGSAIFTASIDGNGITSGDATVVYTFSDIATFLIEDVGGGNIGTQTAGSSFNIKITAKDAHGNTVESFDGPGNSVNITSSGTLTSGGGTTSTFTNGVLSSHSVTITSAGSRTITARKTASFQTATSNSFTVNPSTTSATTTTITPTKSYLQNNGSDNTTITIQLKDQYGNNLTTNPGTINVSKGGANASISTPATYVSNGRYTSTLTASSTIETVTITANLNNTINFTDDAVVVITQFNEWEGDAGGNQLNKIDWGNTSNWSLGVLPTLGQVVMIPTGLDNYPIIDGEDPSIDFLVIENGANVTLVSRTITINNEISGDGSIFGNDGIINIGGDSKVKYFIAGSSNVYFNGSTAQVIENDFTADSLFISNNVTANDYLEAFSGINISTGKTLTMTAGSQLVSYDDINIDGTLKGTNAKFTFSGNINVGVSGSIDLTNTSLVANGSSAQQINGINNLRSFTVDNPSGVVINDDLVVTDTLFINDGTLTLESGTSFVSNIKQGNITNLIARRQITGTTGWRLLSPPIDSDYDDFLDGTITQGYAGAFYSTGSDPGDTLQPNVLYYDELILGTDNQRWRKPASAATSLTPGRGLFVYFFGNQPLDPLYNNAFPITLQTQGAENDGDGTSFTFPITYTAAADSGWNLVGNPFTATINWDDGNWTKTNMNNSIYVWDPATNDYLTWNGLTGSLGDGKIAPFQGFWVKANGVGAPTLKVNKTSKTIGGTFYKASRGTPTIELTLKSDSLVKTTHFSFTEAGSAGKDDFDTYRLLPFDTNTYLELFSLLDDGTQLAINNLPRDFGIPIDIPIYVNGIRNGIQIDSEYTLSWKGLKQVPESWTIKLLDRNKKEISDLNQTEEYSFNVRSKNKIQVPKSAPSKAAISSKNKALNKEVEFYLRITPGEDASELPKKFELSQNYPNPFNPTTNLQISLPLKSEVNLTVYDVLGRVVSTLVNQELAAGVHTIEWDASQFSSGVYFTRLTTPKGVFVKKMTLIK